MTREIKFRMFIQDWAGGRMVYDDFAVNEKGEIYLKSDEQDIYIRGKSNYKLMQSTGLKDQKGVEIYEGDIVKIPTEIPNTSIIASISYEENMGGFFAQKSDGNEVISARIDNADKRGIEVIGNVFSNPELLSKPV